MKYSEKHHCFFAIEVDANAMPALVAYPIEHADGRIDPTDAVDVSKSAFTETEFDRFIEHVSNLFDRSRVYMARAIHG